MKVKKLQPLEVDEYGRPLSSGNVEGSEGRRPESVPPGFQKPTGLGPLTEDGRPRTTPALTKRQEEEQKRMQAFWERQKTFGQEFKQKMAKVQREAIVEARKVDNIHFWGDKGIEGFHLFLKSRFGTLPAAWRCALDTFNNGRLSFAELCKAAHIMGYTGNIKEVWEKLDTEGTGFITLANLDPDADQALKDFRHLLNQRYGNPLKAWKNALDTDGNHRLDEAQFVERCKKIGYHGNGKKLFRYLQLDPGRKYLTLTDIDRAAELADRRGDDNMVCTSQSKWLTQESPKRESALDKFKMASQKIVAANMVANAFGALLKTPEKKSDEEEEGDKSPERATMAHRWSMECAKKQRTSLLLDMETKLKLDVGMKSLEDFKACLLVRFGSLLGAWRELLDRDGHGHVSFGEFSIALRGLGYQGNIKTVWKSLDHDRSGFISFWNLDPQIAEAISSFKAALRDMYGNLLTAWYKGLDPKRKGRVEEFQFVECCNKVGWAGNARWLFRNLQAERGRKFLTLADFDTQAHNALSRGDFRMVTEKKERVNPITQTFNERQNNCFSTQWSRAQSIAQREGIKEISDQLRALDIGAGNLDSFKALLVRRFGSITAAWRNHLDADANGKLSFGEFCQAVRMIGYTGNLKNLWKELDDDCSGTITLKELDAEAHQALKGFRAFLWKKYGDFFQAWKKGLDVNKNGTVDEQEFIQALKDMGYPGNAKKLFSYLRADQGKRWITISDIDPEITAAIYRGDYRMLTYKLEDDDEEQAEPATEEERAQSPSGQPKGATRNSVWNEELGKRIKENAAKVRAAEKNRQMGAQTLDAFKRQLLIRYGSTVTAWRNALDNDGNGKISFGEFCMACRDLSYNGNLKALWAELDDDGSGLITLNELDPVAAITIEKYREFLLEKFGNMVTAWHQGLDISGQIRLTEEEFEERCRALGYDYYPKRTFKFLLPESGRRHIVIEDLEALLIGVPDKEKEKMWRGEKKQAEIGHKKAQMEIKSLDGFKRLLITKFGSLYAGWRKGLDQDRNGLVTKSDFAQGCRSIGYMGNGNSLWKLLDDNGDGIISLRELDEEVGIAVGNFQDLCIEKYGSMIEGWKKALDSDGNGRLDKDEFVDRVKKLGYKGNAAKLFKMLQPEAGRKFITLDDLGTREAEALRRGDWMLDEMERKGPTRSQARAENLMIGDKKQQSSSAPDLNAK